MTIEQDKAAHQQWLRLAARIASRGVGSVEPNPPVGCVIVSPDGDVVGMGHHRRFGGPHAEVEALRCADERARGATAYVTLEPCRHEGKTPPCTEALIDAGIVRVIAAMRDPGEESGGGIERLREAGIEAEIRPCRAADQLAAPWLHRARTGLPWIIAKWAQTLDGRVATRTGESQWISSPVSRRLVHRMRGRVDAMLTGIGTVRADDPLLTPRGVPIRKRPMRIVVDPDLETPTACKLVQTARQWRTIILTSAEAAEHSGRAAAMEEAGAEVMAVELDSSGRLDVRAALRALSQRDSVCRVMVEGGTGLLSGLFEAGLVNECRTFIGPLMLGDESAMSAVSGRYAPALRDGISLELWSAHRCGPDTLLRYGVRTDDDS